jgi:hypothetical protein
MNKVNTLCAAVLLFLSASASAQVKFKLSYDFSTEYYTASVIPDESYVYPNNITAVGQVTIKVPTNAFDPVDIVSHLVGMKWEANARNNSPAEAPDFDYISFGLILQGLATPDYVANEELSLFSFKNAYGCNTQSNASSIIYLVDNESDPFMPPNSQGSNIGNAMTILGAEGVEYSGIVGSQAVSCDPSAVLSTHEQIGLSEFSIFPNPATHFVNVNIKWDGDADEANILVMDALGKQVSISPVNLSNGSNTQKIIVENLPAGTYWVYLAGKDWKVGLDRFSKQ